MDESIGIIEVSQYEVVMGDSQKAFLNPRLKFASLWFDTLLFEDLWNSKYVILPELMGQDKPSFSDTVEHMLSLSGAHDDTIEFFKDKWRGIYDSNQQEHYLNYDRNEIKLSKEVNEFIVHWENDIEQKGIEEGWHPIDASKEAIAKKMFLERAVSQSLWLPPSTSLVVENYIYDVMQKLGEVLTAKATDFAQETIRARIPDISKLTWDEVSDLCHTSKHESFRNKVRSISDARKDLTIAEAKRFCQSVIQDEMVDLIKLQRPNELHDNAIQGILGNTTPLGWVYSTKQLVQDKRIEKDYAWLYFLLDLDDIARPK